MTLCEFIQSKKIVSLAEAKRIIGDEWFDHSEPGTRVHVYGEKNAPLYIEEYPQGTYHLYLNNDEYESKLIFELVKKLHNFYIDECCP